jgi:hypothetical protein
MAKAENGFKKEYLEIVILIFVKTLIGSLKWFS